MWFYVQELPKAQPAVVLVLKRLRRRGNGLKSHPTDWEKPGIEPATPGLQDIGLSPTPRRLLNFIFSDFALMSLKWILAQICAFQWIKVKWCFERAFYHFTIFGFKKCKNQNFEEYKGFEGIFRIEVQVISNPSSRLEKNKETPNPWIFAYERFFTNLLTKSSFSTFSNIFENNQLHILISLYVFYFMFVLFDLILYVPSTIFQLNRDGSSWLEPVLS